MNPQLKRVLPYLKFIIPLLLAAAVALGLYRGYHDDLFDARLESFQRSGGDNLSDYLPREQTPIETTTTFLAVGDIMLSRNVAGTMAKAKDPLLPFRSLESLLKSVDFNFGNLESPLSGRSDFNPTGSLVFNAPPAYAAGLAAYNFKILNLANNHALDQAKQGIDYTLQYLDDQGIKRVGLGQNLDEAWQPAVIESKGIKIAFIGASYSSINDGGQARNTFVARIDDTERLRASVATARLQSDFVVVTMHAGTEYVRKPHQGQIDFAHSAIDAGADMVIGAHPHWIQTTEQYKGKYIFYSLGNFIFDQMWSQDTREGLVLKITLASKKVGSIGSPDAAMLDDLQGPRIAATVKQIELIPVIIDNYCCPRMADEKEAMTILKKINSLDKLIK